MSTIQSISAVPQTDRPRRRRAALWPYDAIVTAQDWEEHLRLLAEGKPLSGPSRPLCLLLGLPAAVLALARHSRRPAHPRTAALPGRFRRRLQGLERESATDPGAAGCLVRRGSDAKDPPSPDAVRPPDCPTVFCWAQFGEGALGLGPADGAAGAERGHAGSPATSEACASRLLHSARMHRARTVPAPTGRGVCTENARQTGPNASDLPTTPVATLLGPPPDCPQTPTGAMPVAHSLSWLPGHHWFAQMFVHTCPYPPKRPLP